VNLSHPVVFEDGYSLCGGKTVGQRSEIGVAGIGERFLRNKGTVGLGMRAGQIPVAAALGEVQGAAAKDLSLGQDFPASQGGGKSGLRIEPG
jgi:hypothetical protein